MSLNGVCRALVDLKAEPRRKSNGTERPQVVFLQSGVRIANGAKRLCCQVFPSADKVDHLIWPGGERIEKHRIDREVTATSVRLGTTEMDVVGASPIRIRPICAKGRDFDSDVALAYQNDAKGSSNLACLVKYRLQPIGRCVSCDVKVRRRNAEQLVTHAAAGEVSDVPAGAKHANDVDRCHPRGTGRTGLTSSHHHARSVTAYASPRWA